MTEQVKVDFEQFRTSWLEGVQEGSPSTRELGRRFALKLVTQWLDASESTSDMVFCDGTGDGGIDVAILDTGDDANEQSDESGHSWYLVQSKYGTAFSGVGTLLKEGQKIIDSQHRVDGFFRQFLCLQLFVLLKYLIFRRLQYAVQTAKHCHRQHHPPILRWTIRASQFVSDAENEINEFVLIGHSLPQEF